MTMWSYGIIPAGTVLVELAIVLISTHVFERVLVPLKKMTESVHFFSGLYFFQCLLNR